MLNKKNITILSVLLLTSVLLFSSVALGQRNPFPIQNEVRIGNVLWPTGSFPANYGNGISVTVEIYNPTIQPLMGEVRYQVQHVQSGRWFPDGNVIRQSAYGIPSGGTSTVLLTWYPPSNAPKGYYNAFISLFRGRCTDQRQQYRTFQLT